MIKENDHRGVHWVKRIHKWRAQISRNKGKRISIGVFDNLLDAVKAYKEYEKSFPPRPQRDFINNRRVFDARHYKKDKCDKCGSIEKPTIHHIVPINWGGEFSKENCATLCWKCHREAHKIINEKLNLKLRNEIMSKHKDEIKKLLCG